MSFSLTQPYCLQDSTFVFAHHCIHILGRELMLNKYLSNIPRGCAREDKGGWWVSLEEETSGCSNKLVILRALHHTFEKRSWELWSNIVTDSIKTLKIVHTKGKKKSYKMLRNVESLVWRRERKKLSVDKAPYQTDMKTFIPPKMETKSSGFPTTQKASFGRFLVFGVPPQNQRGPWS